jgi:fatty acid desaturase
MVSSGLELRRDGQPVAVGASYRRGYPSPSQLRSAIAGAHRTGLLRTTTTGLADVVSIVVLCVGAGWLWAQTPGWGAVTALQVLAGVGRQLRALECLVHEASHFNWSRRHRVANDILATILAVLPTGARLGGYRASHLQHHGMFGTSDDPDLQRYRELGLEDLDRRSAAALTAGLLKRLGAYQRGWVDSLSAAPVTGLVPQAWAAVAILLPAWVMGGAECAVAATAMWIVAFGLVLPVIRFIAESSEHIYRNTDTVFDATVSNLGLVQRALFHPHGDGYHTVHHMWPGVPHHRIAKLHRTLLANDPAYAARLMVRTKVLQDPVRGVPTAHVTGG